MELLDNMAATVSQPFVGELDLKQLFLVVGVIMVFIVAWGFIFGYVKRAASAVADAVT